MDCFRFVDVGLGSGASKVFGVTVEIESVGGLVVGSGFAVARLEGAGVAVGVANLAVGVIVIVSYA